MHCTLGPAEMQLSDEFRVGQGNRKEEGESEEQCQLRYGSSGSELLGTKQPELKQIRSRTVTTLTTAILFSVSHLITKD